MRISNFLSLCAIGLLTSCASSPMKSRLDKNFVYNCSLELIKKDVLPVDAEKICTSAHQSEIVDNQRDPAAREPAVVRVPASETPPAPTPATAETKPDVKFEAKPGN